ncbi:type II secretion system major pseudopilin GspG [Paraglaciecola arctica]|nr:type II secretion system major pseudopilin GspG [Paraglaciecola arctica]
MEQKTTTLAFTPWNSIRCFLAIYRVFSLIITLFFVTYAQTSLANSSNVHMAKIDIQSLSKALEMYHKEFGRYPSTEEGLAVLTQDLIVDPSCEIKKTGFITRLPHDPWENEYQYLSPGSINSSGFDIWSYGADGQEGGDGLNSDCGNWKSDECNKIQSRRNTDYTPLFFMSLFGLVLGLPIYLYKSIANWKVSGNLKASLKGFHLGILVYLVLAPVLLGVLLFSFINY